MAESESLPEVNSRLNTKQLNLGPRDSNQKGFQFPLHLISEVFKGEYHVKKTPKHL